VRCWPEFFTELGCAACGAMSMLNDERCPASCEADVNGTVTSVLLQALSGGLAFITDLVSIDGESDTGVLWHCGLAPAGMADPEAEILATIHSNRELPLLFEFPLKPGRVTLARLHRTGDQGEGASRADAYRLVIGGGEMQQAAKSFTGTSGIIRFDAPATDVLDTVMGAGLEHHFNITYGDYRQELRDFARLVGLDVLELT
jgi:L-fucose isomerase-like protein